MEWYYWLAIILGILLIAVFAVSFYCYRRVFYSPPRTERDIHNIDLPDGDDYSSVKEAMVNWILWARSLPHEDCSVRSYDGLTLRGKYYEYEKALWCNEVKQNYEKCRENKTGNKTDDNV